MDLPTGGKRDAWRAGPWILQAAVTIAGLSLWLDPGQTRATAVLAFCVPGSGAACVVTKGHRLKIIETRFKVNQEIAFDSQGNAQ